MKNALRHGAMDPMLVGSALNSFIHEDNMIASRIFFIFLIFLEQFLYAD